jgi:hypothetical protein
VIKEYWVEYRVPFSFVVMVAGLFVLRKMVVDLGRYRA